jgi:hypothetical protein
MDPGLYTAAGREAVPHTPTGGETVSVGERVSDDLVPLSDVVGRILLRAARAREEE